jgi:hypothetical protein
MGHLTRRVRAILGVRSLDETGGQGMQRERRVQVVLGEAERADGLLRFVLEAEGFDLIGLASSDEELSRVLRGAKPSVVVLDGGISAAAALDARQRIGGAALVVVWPDGVSAVLAEERVEPHMVIEDLGDAVRRAAARVERADTIVVPDAETPERRATPVPLREPAVGIGTRPPLAQPWRRRGRAAQILVAAATWLLVITAFTAIAAAVPHVVETFRGREHAPRPSSAPPSTAPPSARPAGPTVTPASEPDGQQRPDRCDDGVRGQGADRADGEGAGDPVRAQGCPKDRATSPKGSGGGGKPDDPGSQGEGNGSLGVPPEETGSPGQDPQGEDPSGDQSGKSGQGGQGSEGGKSEERGNAGAGQEERGRSGESGTSDHG